MLFPSLCIVYVFWSSLSTRLSPSSVLLEYLRLLRPLAIWREDTGTATVLAISQNTCCLGLHYFFFSYIRKISLNATRSYYEMYIKKHACPRKTQKIHINCQLVCQRSKQVAWVNPPSLATYIPLLRTFMIFHPCPFLFIFSSIFATQAKSDQIPIPFPPSAVPGQSICIRASNHQANHRGIQACLILYLIFS